MRDADITLADGRRLAYTDSGDPDGIPVFFSHGTPTSRLRVTFLSDAFAGESLRVISPDRPGFGGSTPQPGRAMTDWPADVAALADVLGIDRFLVAGHSSGGAYAVVTASLLGERVRGGVVLGGLTDMAWPEAWTDYLEDRFERDVMTAPDEETARARLATAIGEDGSGFASQVFELPEPDVKLFEDDAMATVSAAARAEAFRQGVVGYAQDLFVEGHGWSFDASSVRVPMLIVHGDRDTLVPLRHSEHTASLIRSAAVRVLPGHGHLTILAELPALLAEVASAGA